MNIIEKLESFQQQLIGVGQTAAACDLQNIIEEYKATEQEPVEYQIKILGERWTHCAKHIYDPNNPNTRALFPHPQPSDETVKDAERYRWLRSGGKDLGGEVFMYGYSPKGLDESIDEAMKAKL